MGTQQAKRSKVSHVDCTRLLASHNELGYVTAIVEVIAFIFTHTIVQIRKLMPLALVLQGFYKILKKLNNERERERERERKWHQEKGLATM